MSSSHLSPMTSDTDSQISYIKHIDPRDHKKSPKVAILLGVFVLVLLVSCGLCGYCLYESAMTVKAEAKAMIEGSSGITTQLKTGDSEKLAEYTENITSKMNFIYEEVNTPLWVIAAHLPVLGSDIKSVRTLADIGHELVDDGLVPLADALSGQGIKGLFSSGSINVDLLTNIVSVLKGVLPEVKEAITEVEEMPDAKLSQVATYVNKAKNTVSGMSDTIELYEPYLDLILPMVGAGDQTRNYLVIAQNNAELRATGGLPGSWMTLSFTNGVISKSDSVSILHWGGVTLDITEEEATTAGTNINTDAAQVNWLPDFTRVGELAAEYYRRYEFGEVDGVVAVDPVFLANLLELTGGFTLEDGTYIDHTNVAQLLMHDVYITFGEDGEGQDAYFALVAAAAFNSVMDNLSGVDFTELFDLVLDSAKEGRLIMWMKNSDEEAAIKTLGLAGELKSDPTSPVLGVYLDDDTISKISWYCSVDTQIGEPVLNADGTSSYQVTTTVTNHLSAEEAETLPTYIRGSDVLKRSVDDMRDFVYFFAPAKGSITNMTVNDGIVFEDYGIGGFRESSLSGLQVICSHIHLYGGESAVFSYTVTVSADATETLSLKTTPLARQW